MKTRKIEYLLDDDGVGDYGSADYFDEAEIREEVEVIVTAGLTIHELKVEEVE